MRTESCQIVKLSDGLSHRHASLFQVIKISFLYIQRSHVKELRDELLHKVIPTHAINISLERHCLPPVSGLFL